MKSTSRKLPLLALTVGAIVVGVSAVGLRAMALTADANMLVSASVSANCTISTTTDLSFGAYDPVGTHSAADLDATGTLSVACTKNSAGVTIALDQGLYGATGSTCAAPARQMSDGGTQRLAYNLYSDAGRSSAWGCQSGTNLVSYAPTTSAASTFTVYGRIPGGQDVAVGSYNDTIVATITF